MAQHGWFDFLRRGRPEAAAPVQGLVLSGGGSRVSFQLGALDYLYGHDVIAPSRIVGTSGGAIVATVLAQSLEVAEQAAALAELDAAWMGMTSAADMFVEQAWFTRLRQEAGDLKSLLPAPDPREPATTSEAEPVPAKPGAKTEGSARSAGPKAPAAADAEALIRAAMEDDPSEAADWSVSQVWQMLSVLPRIGRVTPTLASAVRGAGLAQSMFRPGPIVTRLLYEGSFEVERVRTSGVELRIAMVGLNSGDLHFMCQDGRLVDRENAPLGEGVYELALGVWASCAIPGVFRPVEFAGEVYVDGGVREHVPVEMAVSHLGVTHPYVIVASPPGVERADYAGRDIVSSVLRANTLTSDEAMGDEVEWARGAGAVVIDPQVNVHDSMTVEPGLLWLNHDYGYMRAAEEITGATESARQRTRDLVQARVRAWHLAAALAADEAGAPSTLGQIRGTAPAMAPTEAAPDAAAELADLTRQIHELVAATDPALLPPGA